MKNKNFMQRMTSALTASVVLLTSLPLSPVSWINIDLSFFHAKAEDGDAIDIAALEQQFPSNTPNFKTVDEFIEYCYCYREDPVFAAAHETDTIDAPFTDDGANKYIKAYSTTGCDFTGLGTALHPFRGSIQFDSSTSTYSLPTDSAPLFDYVCDNVQLKYSGGLITT